MSSRLAILTTKNKYQNDDSEQVGPGLILKVTRRIGVAGRNVHEQGAGTKPHQVTEPKAEAFLRGVDDRSR